MISFNNDWDEVLADLLNSPLYQEIRSKLKEEYANYEIYPPMDDIFNAFKLTPFSEVKAVILGQDPYHEPGQANGLSFSVKQGVKMPGSLKNIYIELKSDLGIDNKDLTDLTPWAKQGVLLLNSTLTVRKGQANSHSTIGWVAFTNEVIKLLGQRQTPMSFILWGSFARNKKNLIMPQHYIVESAHPSPLSCYNGFFGSKPFSKTNKFLTSVGMEPINWQL